MGDFTVALMKDYGWIETCRPLAIGVDHAVAKSIKRHFDKKCVWFDYDQTGEYVVIVSRKYCINHADFEVNIEDMFV